MAIVPAATAPGIILPGEPESTPSSEAYASQRLEPIKPEEPETMIPQGRNDSDIICDPSSRQRAGRHIQTFLMRGGRISRVTIPHLPGCFDACHHLGEALQLGGPDLKGG